MQFGACYGRTIIFYPVHLTFFMVETRNTSGVFIHNLMTSFFDLVTGNNLKRWLEQDYPGYQRFFLARGGQKSFASLRRRHERRSREKNEVFCVGHNKDMTENCAGKTSGTYGTARQSSSIATQVVQAITQTPVSRAKTGRPIKGRKSRVAGERRVKNM